MPGKVLGRNKHQKAAHRLGEKRVGREEVDELVEMSRSEDAEDRLVAAKNLCPCHVRRRIDAVWEALYRMLEDPDVQVRRAAWHTLEDGGRPDDPALDSILNRVLARETDRQVRSFVEQLAGPRRERDRVVARAQAAPGRKGKCDFCGETNVFVEWDLETMIPSGKDTRAALICEGCRRRAG